ncbi:hypothetical protein BH18ACI5_BH18ACI5_22770 [soil metagenome]
MLVSAAAAIFSCAIVGGQAPDPSAITAGILPNQWHPGGPDCSNVPAFQVHEYNADFFILRQSGCSHYEKPFLYLLFGRDKVMLVDTGAGKADIATVVKKVVTDWQARHKPSSSQLVVVHTHAHGDHTAGDEQCKTAPRTTVVGRDLESVKGFFGIRRWPEQIAEYDLGNRIVDIIPIPGHEPTSIALYDRQTGVLLTGDTVYPGRLYISNATAFTASIRRLVDFTSTRPVTHILGNHIENSRTPFVDYGTGTTYQPEEHALPLARSHLLEIDEALRKMNGNITRLALPDLTLYPVVR